GLFVLTFVKYCRWFTLENSARNSGSPLVHARCAEVIHSRKFLPPANVILSRYTDAPICSPYSFTGRANTFATHARLLLLSPASPGRLIVSPLPLPTPTLYARPAPPDGMFPSTRNPTKWI